MNDIRIVKYDPAFKHRWDEFVENSKNGTFLFKRDYMDYHSDRFLDNSFMVYRNDKLYVLFPACKIGEILSSHAGLTYGGLIMNDKSTTQPILDIFGLLLDRISSEGIKEFIYKPVPHIYHRQPAEEDLYALFRFGAKLSVRNVSSTLTAIEPIKFSTLRRRIVKKADAAGVKVSFSEDLSAFWEILSENLSQKYNVLPVHSIKEILYLKSKFPQIKLLAAFKDNSMIGGVLCYVTDRVLHLQYISATPLGKELGAIDAIIEHIINANFYGTQYLDFGISNEDRGRYLNENLIHQKEGFGARAICYDSYTIPL
ncbi:MAG: GNAT family N-acetyltransferase [Muribaculaceae bacterium]|nr:GNAT family N-acetyltransferase [Muribaculaceae bacterium]